MGSLALCVGVVMGKGGFWGSTGWFGLTQAGSPPYAEPHSSSANAAGLVTPALLEMSKRKNQAFGMGNKMQNHRTFLGY